MWVHLLSSLSMSRSGCLLSLSSVSCLSPISPASSLLSLPPYVGFLSISPSPFLAYLPLYCSAPGPQVPSELAPFPLDLWTVPDWLIALFVPGVPDLCTLWNLLTFFTS